MTLEQLFAEVKSLGLYVNNLFQLHDGTWQANLRNSNNGFEFGHGFTPQIAMRNCIDKVKNNG